MKTHVFRKENCLTDDISNLFELALGNRGYTNEQIVRYSFLIDEALTMWREKLPSDAELVITSNENSRTFYIDMEVQGIKCDPFDLNSENADMAAISRMKDMLAAGVGSEFKYKYKKGTNIIHMRFPKENPEVSTFRFNLVVLAVPIIVQSLLQATASVVDSFTMGFLAGSAMVAIGFAGNFINVFDTILVSMASGSSTLMAQFWGRRNRFAVKKTYRSALVLSLFLSLVFSVAAFLFPRQIMQFYTDIPEAVTAGTTYLKILSPNFFLISFYTCSYTLMRNAGRIRQSVRYSVIGIIVNVVLNIVLVFDLLGLPVKGLNGAATATLISALVQCVLCLADILRHPVVIDIKQVTEEQRRANVIGPMLKIALPIIGHALMWTVAYNIVLSAFGHMGEAIASANSLCTIICNLCVCAAVGLGSSSGILIGNILGRNKLDNAWKLSKLAFGIDLVFAILSSLLFAGVGSLLHLLPLELTEDAWNWISTLIPLFAVKIFFMSMNRCINQGFLFTGGDIMSIFIIDLITMWGVLVPISFIAKNTTLISPVLAAILLNADEMISFPFTFIRYRKKKWVRNIT